MYYFVTFLFLLLSAKGTFLYFFNVSWFLIDLVFIWIGLENNRFNKKDLRLFGNFAAIYICYCLFRSTFINNLPADYLISDIIYLFKYILPSFLFCAILKDKAIYYVSRVITDGAIISIPFFLIQLIAGSTLFSIGRSLGIPPEAGPDYTNFIVFVYVRFHAIQNSGFSWEPGAFGFFLNMGLMLHFLYNNFKFDRRAAWLVLAIITTISTTSYIALIVIFLLYFRARGLKLTTIALFGTPLFLVAAFQLPFLARKIVEIYNHDMQDLQNLDTLADYYIKAGEEMPLNRFSSLIFIYRSFGAKLIMGVSNIYNETIPILKNINISNGILEFFAKFGVIGFLFLMYRAYLFFKKFTYNFEQALYCIILILILGFAESIFVLPLMMAFYFFYYYAVDPAEAVPEDQGSEVNSLS